MTKTKKFLVGAFIAANALGAVSAGIRSSTIDSFAAAKWEKEMKANPAAKPISLYDRYASAVIMGGVAPLTTLGDIYNNITETGTKTPVIINAPDARIARALGTQKFEDLADPATPLEAVARIGGQLTVLTYLFASWPGQFVGSVAAIPVQDTISLFKPAPQ